MLSPISDETLVAYLDGELPQEQQTQITQHLELSPDLRQRISALQASWDLLSDLPFQAPRQDLAQSTIEMVTLAVEQESRSWGGWLAAHPWMVVALASGIMLLAGIGAARLQTHFQTRALLQDLPIIADYPSLQYIDSVEFLQALAAVDNLTVAAGNHTARAIIGDGRVPETLAERQTWIENLPPDSRGRLRNHLEQYRQPQDAQRLQSLREVTEAIYGSPQQTAHYLETIRAYRAFLEAWGEKAKRTLIRGPVDQRIAAIQSRVAVELALNHLPTPADRLAFRAWLDDLIDREDNMNEFYLYTDSQIINDLLSGDPENSLVAKADLDDLIGYRLSPTTAKLLTNIPDEAARRYHLGLWMSTPPASERPPGGKDLQAVLSSLPEQRQNELEFLPEEEVRKRLRRAAEPSAVVDSQPPY